MVFGVFGRVWPVIDFFDVLIVRWCDSVAVPKATSDCYCLDAREIESLRK